MQEDSKDANVVWYRFDLDYKIPAQITKAREELEAIKQGRQRVLGAVSGADIDFFDKKRILHVELTRWQTFLRVLDAEYAYMFENDGSLLKKDLAESIFPELTNEYPGFSAVDRYKKTLSAAEVMMTEEFKQILASA